MENIHNAIAWYQKKIGSYDKQLWEQSVERKLQKGLPNVHHAPRKTVRLKTEYIDVDLIRGSTFTKTKPQVPWIYITKKAFVRILFFPFYYRWWVLQSSRKVFYLLLSLYLLQTVTAFVYFSNLDGSLIEDELTLTEVVVPMGLMFLLGLIHAQTVLAHFSLKPPRRDGRHGSKQKKRERQGGGSLPRDMATDASPGGSSTQQDFTDGPQDGSIRDLHTSSSSRHHRHHHTTSLWNVPHLEVEGTEVSSSSSHPLLSSPRKSASQSRIRGGSKRGEKKSVRIADTVHKLTPTPSPTSVDSASCSFTAEMNSRTLLTSPKDGRREEGRSGEDETTAGGMVNAGEVVKEGLRVAVGGERGTGREVVGKSLTPPGVRKNVGAEGGRSKDATDRSSSGIEDGCESATLYESEPCHHPRQDTTDSDSLAGMYEFVQLDRRVVTEQASDDFTPLSSSHEREEEEETPAAPNELLRKVSVSFVKEVGGSSLVDGIPAGGQREEDNLSDTGHVSNSSNYNPSDSGSEAENCDDGDSVGMPVPKSPLPSPSSLDAVPASSLSAPALNASPRKMAQQQQQLEGESSASEPGSPDARQSVSGIRRRRRTSANQSGTDLPENQRPRPLPPKLLGVRAQSKLTQTSGISSSENEAVAQSAEAVNKATISSEEWEDRMQSDVTTSSSYSTSNSESELSENESNIQEEEFAGEEDLVGAGLPSTPFHDINLLQPPTSTNMASHNSQPDKVSCVIWEGNECKKLDLTALDIGWAIIDKVDRLPESSDYIFIGVAFSFFLGCVPLAYRFYYAKDLPAPMAFGQVASWLWALCRRNSWGQNLIICNGFIQRLILSCIFFFLLTVTDRTFKQRLLYAKHFSYLTSSRRARKFDMPHFRLNKVRNIKIWLSLRSYLKRRGPQRSVDMIVSASFYLTISLVCLMCIQMLKDSETYLDFLCNWELIVWCLALGIYIMRFMTLGLKINKKYRNLSVLITEQINLYLQMEQKPHKKEELTLANNVLRLAEDLLKELESPFKISGFSANPLIYNITKVVVLSAFSAVMTEVLGFKLKLYKIKLK
ncbi:protein PHTF2-like [Babylonia areolata]|uniref:protein PHTF2-like n=1 Tax=Babylonia areolata TaxID=304850 RepID=UPI003FD0DED6